MKIINLILIAVFFIIVIQIKQVVDVYMVKNDMIILVIVMVGLLMNQVALF